MTEEELAQYIVKRYDRLYSDQSNWRTQWQEIADYIHPRKAGNILGYTTPGTKLTDKLYDSTAIHANELLAASMNGALTSNSVKWFSLKIRGLMENKRVSDWLEDCAERMYRAFNQSNFNSEIHECYLDLGAFGTAAIECEENDIQTFGFNGLRFNAYCIGEYVIDEDSEGRVDTVIRKFRLSNRTAYDKWGDKAGDTIKENVKTKPEDEFEILRAVLPIYVTGKIHRLFKNVSFYINYKTQQIMHSGGYREFPTCVPRWSKSSGERYGRGQGSTALPDTKTLNKEVELELKALAKVIDPPLEVLDDGVIGNVKLQPAGLNYVRNMGNIKPIEFGAKFNLTQVTKEDLKTSIRRIFFADQLQFQDTPQMTATEVYVRYELMQRLLGPTLGRLKSELFNPLIERVFGLMLRAGAFLPMPRELLGREIDIEYEGPMERAQRSSEVIAVQRTFEIVGPLAQANPDMWDYYDMDKIAKFAPTVTGMPSSLLRDDNEVLKLREIRKKQMEAQQQKQDLMNLAEGAGKVAPLLSSVGELTKPKQGE